ncbi:hypothetical protein BEH_24215 [Priestia filamentosa]|uniref:Uncharacterized protein n=1 Tax=Priestia filamentosa TaxID=1402861 RepID=A0A2S1LZB7_9BACI|nr:zinc-ribbon domain-containing protein [Priestia filamentosa]AWG44158.1 hypothetical protein BEH_24215 [Priestia filamentosa]
MTREVYLDNLPKWETGGNKGRIDWSKSAGYKVGFLYNDVKGYIEILDYDKNKQILVTKYKNNTLHIKTSHFKKGAIGNLLGLINHAHTYNKGDVVKVSTGNIEVLDQILIKNSKNHTVRGYKYKCLNDGYIGEVSEPKLKNKNGCSVCSNRIIIKGINDVATTHPHLLSYFINKNDAYRNSYGSRKEVLMQCPNCEHKKKYSIDKLTKRGFPCRKCGDGISYPEKFIFNLLEQLNIVFEIQKVFEWSDSRQYDFYLPELNLIIETHGLQHYENNYSFSPDVKLKDIQENDNYKYKLALRNNIYKYIVLDCREWENNWIKDSIENSDLAKIFDLSKINWINCHMFSCSSRVKEVCDLWSESISDTKLISEKIKLSRQTVIKYLKQGSELGWCDYNPKKNMSDNGRNNIMKRKTNLKANSHIAK